MNRTLNVVRMQLINRQTFVWMPLLVLAIAIVITFAIYGVIRAGGADGPMYGMGFQAPLWYFLVVGVQALTLTFPFSQAMSITRREFFTGTLLTAALTSAMLTVIFMAGAAIEEATGGWGLNGYFFFLPWAFQQGWLVAALFSFAVAILFFLIGFLSATVYKRFGTAYVLVGYGILALALIGAAFLITVTASWPEVGQWIATVSPIAVTGIVALVAAASAAASFAALRRATP